MQPLIITKIGGNLIDDEKKLNQFLADFAQINTPKILVHGGGKIATEVAASLGIDAKMVDGRRITDAEMLKVVTMVYGGLVSKNIVSKLQASGCNAIGLTGADSNIIEAHKRPVKTIDYGFAGDIDRVNPSFLKMCLESKITPVCAPLTHDGKGHMLNTNADTIASALAIALSKDFAVKLLYCFELNGVLKSIDDPASIIPEITLSSYKSLKQQGIISKGMIPKLDNAFDAINAGVQAVHICNGKDILKISSGEAAGTLLTE